ncbi:MAG: hypothetical protein ACI8W8_004819, partial [Rhodothermales bacterium]
FFRMAHLAYLRNFKHRKCGISLSAIAAYGFPARH